MLGKKDKGRRCSTRITLEQDRKSTRLNPSHRTISYAVFCLKKKIKFTVVNAYIYDTLRTFRVLGYPYPPQLILKQGKEIFHDVAPDSSVSFSLLNVECGMGY